MGHFQATSLEIEDLLLIEPTYLYDNRGYFVELYNERDFDVLGIQTRFVQDNESRSGYGMFRGLHYQWKHPQAKLVRAVRGEILDIVVDMRTSRNSFGKCVSVLLSEENRRQLYVPEGFAHGYLVLSEYAVFSYKCSDFYTPGDEYGISLRDPALGITLPALNGHEPFMNERDLSFPTLSEAQSQGLVFS